MAQVVSVLAFVQVFQVRIPTADKKHFKIFQSIVRVAYDYEMQQCR